MLLTNFDGEPTRKLMKRAREMGKITVLDTAWDFDDVWLPKIEACLPELDYFIPSVEEAAKITGEEDPVKIAQKLHTMGPKNIVVKVGKDGALVSPEGEEMTLVPAFLIEKPVDTTGAGDSFCAGVAIGMTYGKTMAEAVEIGTTLAASVITSSENVCPRFLPEELGLDVVKCKYMSSRYHATKELLMLNFIVVVEDTPLKLKEDEIAEARWCSPEEALQLIRKGTLAEYFLINAVRELKKKI